MRLLTATVIKELFLHLKMETKAANEFPPSYFYSQV